jgi:hypothetical protein
MANKTSHEEISLSLSKKEMQIKTTLRFHLPPFRMAIIKNTTTNVEDMGGKEPLYIVGGNVN